MTQFREVSLAGFPKPLVIPTWIVVEERIISHPRFRSFQKRGRKPDFSAFHDTGNPGTDADGEWKWANAGRPGAPVGGYTGIYDSKKYIHTQPADEVTWAQATVDGNLRAMAFEQAWGSAGGNTFEGSLAVGVWIHAAAIVAWDLDVDTALRQHNFFSGKDCPGQVRRRGMWSEVVRRVGEAADEIRAFQRGTVENPYKDAAPIEVLVKAHEEYEIMPSVLFDPSSKRYMVWVGDRVKAIRQTPRYRYAAANGGKVGPDLITGDEFDVDWAFQTADDTWWFITPYWTRVKVEDTERISDSRLTDKEA